MKHRAQSLRGEWVVGWYYMVNDDHYIRLNQYDFDKIKPETLSIETFKFDSADNMIFGSFELDGVMTQGGDVVNVLYEGQCEVRYDKNIQAFILWHIERNKMLEWLGVHSPDGLTIIGKPSEVFNGN